MENTRSLTGANAYKALDLLHDRTTRFVARLDLDLLALQVAGAAVLLEIIFSLNAFW